MSDQVDVGRIIEEHREKKGKSKRRVREKQKDNKLRDEGDQLQEINSAPDRSEVDHTSVVDDHSQGIGSMSKKAIKRKRKRKKRNQNLSEEGDQLLRKTDETDKEVYHISFGNKDSLERMKSNGETGDGVVEDDLNEPTMGEKLEKLNLVDGGINRSHEKQDPSPVSQPRADSVNVLLKQALHADDRAVLLDCLYTQDEKVIANSISLLNPSDVLKLLQFLISIVESSRGAVLVCALPWLRRLLLQHASGIVSQEASLVALNSLYQLIESRVSTFRPALQLSVSLDVLYTGVIDEKEEEDTPVKPVIYEDHDSEEEESEDAIMDVDHHSPEEETSDIVFEGDSDADEMSD
ncbi:uncharacterized protein J3R85_016165 [Psidium guajava]|nr:uncharacterized protein J3R85_016165 [Psidium guajava]